MKITLPSLLGSLLLIACTPATVPQSGGHTMMKEEQASTLTLQDKSDEKEIAFVILKDNNVFNDYGISHTKEMHLIVVRDDLRHFRHLHPERDEQGVWHTAFKAPAGGNYRLYADFVEGDGAAHTLKFERSYQGKPGTSGIMENLERVRTVDGYRVEMQSFIVGDEVLFSYTINDAKGKPVVLEQYLGALGHSVLLSPSGEFIHTHPSEGDPTPIFTVPKLMDNFYRVFTQFQINGKVITADFDWKK